MANKLYKCSYGPDEGKVLEGLSGEKRQAILEVSGVVDYAKDINDALNQVLRGKDKGEEYILKLDNPRVRNFNLWINGNNENKIWYENNKDNLKLIQDNGEICVEILGDIFEPEDEKVQENGKDIGSNNGNTYFTRGLAERIGKRIPDWQKYINFLPGNNKNKVNFLINVLGLSFAGYCSWNNGYCYGLSRDAYYWSNSPNSNSSYILTFNASIIYPAINFTRANGFSVHCLRN